MRGLVLVAVLATAMPAFGAEDSVPVAAAAATDAAPEVGAPSAAPTRDETARAEEPAQGDAVPAPAPLSADAVARATFATAIEEREPVDSITSLESDRSRVYYFTELIGISGREVTHRWEYRGEVMAEVPIAIGGPRWRAYSSKGLDATQLGEWTVSVIDESGGVLRTDTFTYEATAPTQEMAGPLATPVAPVVEEATEEMPASPPPTQR